jgi:hypothetical protein
LVIIYRTRLILIDWNWYAFYNVVSVSMSWIRNRAQVCLTNYIVNVGSVDPRLQRNSYWISIRYNQLHCTGPMLATLWVRRSSILTHGYNGTHTGYRSPVGRSRWNIYRCFVLKINAIAYIIPPSSSCFLPVLRENTVLYIQYSTRTLNILNTE